MSTAAAAGAEAPIKKKGKMKGIMMILIIAIVFAGVGVGAGLYAAGAGLVGGKAGPKVDPNAPKLVSKDGHEASDDHGEEAAPGGSHGEKTPDPTKYKATYYTFEQPFTANLRDSDGFAQIGLGASTFYDQKVIDNLKENEMPIRSAILMVLSEQDSFSISTPEGKVKLQKELKEVINRTLKQRTGYEGIDNIYFTSMVVQ